MPQLLIPITQHGPILEVLVGISAPHAQVLGKTGGKIVQPAPARLLIDTGATQTCINMNIVTSVGLRQVGTISMHSASTQGAPHPYHVYDASLTVNFPSAPAFTMAAVPIIGTRLANANIDGLLGRDFLAQSLFIYNGTAKQSVLAF